MNDQALIKTTYTVFYPDGREIHGSVDWPEDPSFARIDFLVGPLVEGPIEHVTVIDPARWDAAELDPEIDRRDMFIDEMGHIRGSRPPVRNERATAIYRANYLRGNPGTPPEDLPWIAGTAVLFDRIVWR